MGTAHWFLRPLPSRASPGSDQTTERVDDAAPSPHTHGRGHPPPVPPLAGVPLRPGLPRPRRGRPRPVRGRGRHRVRAVEDAGAVRVSQHRRGECGGRREGGNGAPIETPSLPRPPSHHPPSHPHRSTSTPSTCPTSTASSCFGGPMWAPPKRRWQRRLPPALHPPHTSPPTAPTCAPPPRSRPSRWPPTPSSSTGWTTWTPGATSTGARWRRASPSSSPAVRASWAKSPCTRAAWRWAGTRTPPSATSVLPKRLRRRSPCAQFEARPTNPSTPSCGPRSCCMRACLGRWTR